jgi:hypothetical protein
MNRYKLEPYKSMKNKYYCPKCNKKDFTRYIDITTNEQVNIDVGMCNNWINCNYHFTPKQYFKNNHITPKPSSFKAIKTKPKVETSFINSTFLDKSIKNKATNFFIDYLASIWDYEIAYFLAEKYKIGSSSKYWKGSTVFWQEDINGNIRTGKIMLYDPINGKRIKKPYNHINWIHCALKASNFNLEQCFFGEHLLNDEIDKPVAIVESEKTAIMLSIFIPDFIWLACGSLNNLNQKKTEVLKGRSVVLFPDLGCYNKWNDKIPYLTKLATFRTSTLLEEKASAFEKSKGYDLLDFVLMDNDNYQELIK